jgi:hypothetical protein
MFIGYDSWVEQYFKDAETPENVTISCNDTSAWKNNPNYNWVYNKLELCKSQGIEACPHGVKPTFEPVFSKPIINLYGKNRGAHKIFGWDDSEYLAGHFWMPVLTGTHLSSDMAIVDGICEWIYTMQAFEDDDGNISRYESCNDSHLDLSDKAKIWALQNLKGYTGLVNIETIGGKIIDCHLRMTPRFVDLYSDGWLNSVVTLYHRGTWHYEKGRAESVSYTLRALHPGHYTISDPEKMENLKEIAGSIQFVFKQTENINNGDRLVIVNGHDAEQVNEIINAISKIIILTDDE